MCIAHNHLSGPADAGRPPVHKGNPVRGPLNAAFFNLMDGYINFLVRRQKGRLFADLPEKVVELGAGVGANFRYMKPGTQVVAVEPNRHMHKGLIRCAERRGIDLALMPTGAEAIDLPDNSVEAVICTLVLCTVDDPVRVLREVRRILKPGGRFIFLEHVAAREGSWRHRLQLAVHGPWRYVFEGCNTNRETESLVRAAGFSQVEVERYTLTSPFLPFNTQIAGQAVA